MNGRGFAAFAEQSASSFWNLVLAFSIAKLAPLDFFGAFAIINACYFIASATAVSMTVGVASVDAAHRPLVRDTYLNAASWAALSPVFLLSVVATAVAILAALLARADWHWVLPFCLFYIPLSIWYDVARRFGVLGSAPRAAVASSSFRAISLAVLVALSVGSPSAPLVILGGTVLLTAISVWWVTRRRAPVNARLVKIAAARQIRVGRWLALGTILSSAFEQALAVSVGAVVGAAQVGAWRAASYLFALLNPYLQAADLMLPGYLARWHPSRRDGAWLARYFIAIVAISVALASLVGALIVLVWLPALGPTFVAYWPITLVYVGIYSLMQVRTGLLPLLKVRFPRLIPIAAGAGLVIGTGYIAIAPPASGMGIAIATLAFAATMTIVIVGVAFRVHRGRS